MALPSRGLDYLESSSIIETSTPGQAGRVVCNSDGSAIGGGNVAHDAVDSGNPLKIGAYAVNPSSLPSDVAAGDRTNVIADLKGRLINYLGTALDATNDSVKAIAGASATATGCDIYFNAALTNTVVSIKTVAGNIYGLRAYNAGASIAFIQVFNVTSASVTLGTTTPTEFFPVPASGGIYDDDYSTPATYSSAISIAATSTPTGAVAPANTQVINLRYK